MQVKLLRLALGMEGTAKADDDSDLSCRIRTLVF